ncbi:MULTISPECIES: Crp/Fnr family transcriptional regulator [unclassified Herbaspirillum]|uniref:Crp/Fnr family transcriptional regulator n=1 Tax=unclassified Herbaspirillum TaxID=2624150 RepID=UPI0011ACAC44|nr:MULTISPECIES: Crp/Fnr family transcriptional regulator [unclassified Herbaspirillum]MBB5391980.1 CRP-like cAMP-binding protein [Herbaspirillum sp. SJZ102]TWC71339.1 CRP-like cAMP-binding protein [Herbaspirillum sp. SJZ099]
MSPHENHLIERLPRKERHHLLAMSDSIALEPSAILSEPGGATRHVYFPTDGFISLVAMIDGSPGVEVGMVGQEGMLGVQAVLGINTAPLYSLVQGAGNAWRTEIVLFQHELERSPALRRGMHAYLYVLMAQLVVSAACLRFHVLSQRLARWLLMTQDRVRSDHLHVTHEFLAFMLGVRRVGITTAAATMQREGLIEYRRGHLMVLDRKGLEAEACSCYASDKQKYANFLIQH